MAKAQNVLRFTVSQEAEDAFKLWLSHNGGKPTKLLFAMWKAFLALPLSERRELIAESPSGSEATPDFARIESVRERFRLEQMDLARLPDIGVNSADKRRRKPRSGAA